MRRRCRVHEGVQPALGWVSGWAVFLLDTPACMGRGVEFLVLCDVCILHSVSLFLSFYSFSLP